MKNAIQVLLLVWVFVLSLTFYHHMPHKRVFENNTIIVKYVGNDQIYNAEYLVTTRYKSGKLVVELILGPGEKNVIRMEDGLAQFYLDGMGLNF